MFSHVVVGSNNIEVSQRFYDALFGQPAMVDDLGRRIYVGNGSAFMIMKPIDGQPACHANGGTIGFFAETPEEVDVWHSAGCGAGGTSIEDPPGWREGPFGPVYVAYLRDPDGNKLCGLHRPPPQ